MKTIFLKDVKEFKFQQTYKDSNRYALTTSSNNKIVFYISSDEKMRSLMQFLTNQSIHIDKDLKKSCQFYN